MTEWWWYRVAERIKERKRETFSHNLPDIHPESKKNLPFQSFFGRNPTPQCDPSTSWIPSIDPKPTSAASRMSQNFWNLIPDDQWSLGNGYTIYEVFSVYLKKEKKNKISQDV